MLTVFYQSLKTHASDLIPVAIAVDTLQEFKQQYMAIVCREIYCRHLFSTKMEIN